MALQKDENQTKDLLIWFVEVIFVLLFCSIVIRISLISRPPTYTLTGLNGLTTDGLLVQGRNEIAKNYTSTLHFYLVIGKPNKNKGILHGETKLTVYKNGSVIGKRSLPRFYQVGRSTSWNIVLVNYERNMYKLGEKGTLKVGLETMVRYRILRWTTKQHFLNLEASVLVDQDGNVLVGEEGVKFEPIKLFESNHKV